jgi:crotonobetainyl-CoA:carnitine CoA-transferase CaiB-like acyl-CoA transferase
VFATFLALRDREQHGGGRHVEAVMVEAALRVAAEQLIEYDRTGELLARDGNHGHGVIAQDVYRCAGDDSWVAVTVENDEQMDACRALVGDGEIDEWCAARDPDDAAAQLTKVGVPAAAVIPGRDVVHNEQLRHRGLFEIEAHAVTGEHEIPTMPFRLTGVDQWLRFPSPTLGEHNDEVLGEVATPEELAALREAGVVGEWLAGS